MTSREYRTHCEAVQASYTLCYCGQCCQYRATTQAMITRIMREDTR